jgi:hypothetical protein
MRLLPVVNVDARPKRVVAGKDGIGRGPKLIERLSCKGR